MTVVIAAYNREDILGRALASARNQVPAKPTEILVVDDCSTDRTARVAEAYGARVVRHETNLGAAAARNTGLREASQPWVALLDSDDEWLPRHLAALWGLRGGHVLVAASAVRCRDGSSRARYLGPAARKPVVLNSPAALMYPGNFISASGVMVRRETVSSIGGFNTEWRFAEDFDLWLRLLDSGTGVVSPEITSIYHEHLGQKSRDARARATQHAIVDSYAGRPWWTARLAAKRRAGENWDDFMAAIRARALRRAIPPSQQLLQDPRNLLAAGQMVLWRQGVRRRSRRLGPQWELPRHPR